VNILVLPGDGIGPEITGATLAVLDATNRRFDLGLSFELRDIGFASLETQGTTLPPDVLDRARQVEGIVLGPISHLDYPPPDKGGINVFRRLPRESRPLRQRATGAKPAGDRHDEQAHGPRDHARGDRGLLPGP
jgi:isocitrate/isopropylmalate dehydrogenase